MKSSDIQILAVDDDANMLESISDLFKVFQFQVDTASSGNKAWQLLQNKKYHLVISDIRMPDGDGIELAKRLKKFAPQTSLLFISGFSETYNEEIYHIGAEGIFAKPFDSIAVKKAIQTCLLKPESRWSAEVPQIRNVQIKKKGQSFDDLEIRRSVVFGRGGFFVSHNLISPPIGSRVDFKIEISDPEPTCIEGIGIVRWEQSQAKSNSPSGLGIEILFMPSASIEEYTKYFKDRIAFIPSPRKNEM